MGVTTDLCVPLAPETMDILQSHIDRIYRVMYLSTMLENSFFFNLTFLILRSTLLIASGIAMVFGVWVG